MNTKITLVFESSTLAEISIYSNPNLFVNECNETQEQKAHLKMSFMIIIIVSFIVF